MEHLPMNLIFEFELSINGFFSIGGISEYGMSNSAQMNSDLMHSPRFEHGTYETEIFSNPEAFIVSYCFLSQWVDSDF